MSAAGADLHELLRSCIQCGLCLPHCATYLATGDEVDSPRGRLMLLDALDGAGDEQRECSLTAFDRCLGCHACETACPSGIQTELLAAARARALKAGPPPLPWTRGWLDSARGLGLLRRVAGPLRGIANIAPGGVPRLLGSVPAAPASARDLGHLLDGLHETPPPAEAVSWRATEGPAVACFGGCANEGLLPGATARTRRLLEAAGCTLHHADDGVCCGALASHLARDERRDELRRRNLAAFAGLDVEHIVVEAAGCGLELKEYPEDFAGKVVDAVALLSRLELPPPRTVPLRVVIHDPCHALHGQGIGPEARVLLRHIPGLEILPTPETEVCCGSAGAWSLRHRELSAAIGRRKAALLAGTGAQLVVTSNPGCLGQIADSLARLDRPVPILPLTDLLFYAHLGHRNSLRSAG